MATVATDDAIIVFSDSDSNEDDGKSKQIHVKEEPFLDVEEKSSQQQSEQKDCGINVVAEILAPAMNGINRSENACKESHNSSAPATIAASGHAAPSALVPSSTCSTNEQTSTARPLALHGLQRCSALGRRSVSMIEMGASCGVAERQNGFLRTMPNKVLQRKRMQSTHIPRSNYSLRPSKRSKASPFPLEPQMAFEGAIATIANTNKDMFYTNPKYQRRCVMCVASGKYMNAHYIRKHGEAYLSRVSPSILANYQNEAPHVIKQPSTRGRTFCLFCKKFISANKQSLVLHMTRHTGEYLFQCSKCTKTLAHRGGCGSKSCGPGLSSVKQIREVPFELGALFGYMCKYCNFIQLSSDSLRRHIQTQHNDIDFAEAEADGYAVKLKLVQYPERAGDAGIELPSQNGLVIRNTNRQLYLSNAGCPRSCPICGLNMNKRHFIECHPEQENFLSRLSTRVMAIAATCNSMVTDIHGGYTAECLFCERTLKKTKHDWLVHLTTHTCEYMFKCGACERTTPTARSTCCHQNNIIRFRSFPQQNDISGDACKLCNFVQLSRDHVLQHIRIQHEMIGSSIEENCQSITFIRFHEQPTPPNLPCSIPSATVVTNAAINDSLMQVAARSQEQQPLEPDGANTNGSTAALQQTMDPRMSPVRSETDDDNASTSTQIAQFRPIVNTAPMDSAQPSRPANPQPSTSNTVVVHAEPVANCMPWTNIVVGKAKSIVASMLDDVCLFASYKCMGIECAFSCQSRSRMREHLRFHESYPSVPPNKDYLQCAYCSEFAESWLNLVDHLDSTHATSHFQCQYCFYRSADAYGVVLHQRTYHIGKAPVILLCPGLDDSVLGRHIQDLRKAQLQNIVPIICEGDKVKHYDIAPIIRHLKMIHAIGSQRIKCPYCEKAVDFIDVKTHLRHHNITEYQCLHCAFAANDLDDFPRHMIDQHPNKLMFIAARHLRPDYRPAMHLAGDSTIVVNLAVPIDTDKVRVREMELRANALDAVDICCKLIADLPNERAIRGKDSGLPISPRMQNIIKRHTIRRSEYPLIMLDDYRRFYIDEV